MVRANAITKHPSLLLATIWLLVSLAGSPAIAAGDPKPGVIQADELNMRSGPGRHHPPIATLNKGAQVLVLSYEGEWVRILYKDQTGFIMNREQFLHIQEPGEPVEEEPDQQALDEEAAARLNRELETSRQKVETMAKKESAVMTALEATDKALAQARKKVRRLSRELAATRKRIGTLEGDFREIEARAKANEAYVGQRLAALYKLSWIGKFHVLASADSMFDFFTDKRALEQILAHDEQIMRQLAEDQTQMQALLKELVARKNEQQVRRQKLRKRIAAMKREQGRRKILLEEIRGKKSLQEEALASLKASSAALDETVETLATQPPLGEVPPVVAEKPFEALKGLLMMPVKGKIVSFYGHYKDSRFNVTHFQSGIQIKADRGEPIRAVHSGQTLFSSWFKGFGNMIIIDHGDHYYTVYAHLEEQFKEKGDPVEAGEVIATVGDTGSMTGAGLHFEVRHHGKPMNPLGWIKKG